MSTVSAAPRRWDHTHVLTGRRVRLEPLRAAHLPGLRLAAADLEPSAYTSMPTPATIDAQVAAAIQAASDGLAQPFTVFDADDMIVGSTRLYDLDLSVPKASIGYTWYLPRVRRSGVNTECKLLLMGHAFETLGCHRIAFETSTLNVASRTALAGIGAHEEGILRQHKRHPDGSLRDTVLFSVTDSEWPSVREHLRARLARHEGAKA